MVAGGQTRVARRAGARRSRARVQLAAERRAGLVRAKRDARRRLVGRVRRRRRDARDRRREVDSPGSRNGG